MLAVFCGRRLIGCYRNVQGKYEGRGKYEDEAVSIWQWIGATVCAKMESSNLLDLPNTIIVVVFHCVLNGKHTVLSPKQLQGLYTCLMYSKELIVFINKTGGPRELCIV